MSKLTKADDIYIKHEYTVNNKSSTAIAKELNVSDRTIIAHLKQMGVSIKRPGGGLKTIDIANQRFGKYTVVRKFECVGNTQGAKWQVMCDCGNVREILGKILRSGEATSCGNCSPHYAWKGIGQLSGQYFSSIKIGALKRNIHFNVTKEYLWNLFLTQNKKCAISGLDIRFNRDRSSKRSSAQTASIDRINSSIGYIESNVQWVHKNINIMKSNMTQLQFITFCKAVATNN